MRTAKNTITTLSLAALGLAVPLAHGQVTPPVQPPVQTPVLEPVQTPELKSVQVNQRITRTQVTGPGSRFAPSPQKLATNDSSFEGYDFGHVVQKMEMSVDPLQREMDASFKVFVQSVQEAEQLLDDGKTRQAVQKCSAAIDGVLQVRDQVIGPMWDGQQFLTEQIGKVRSRLARAVAASGKDKSVKLDSKTETALDRIAAQVAQEKDPLRKKRLTAQYRTVRNLAQIKRYAQQLSPDQRKLWNGVLRVLEEAALAHQQVLMGSEVMFAQFEATSSNLHEYLTLIDTVDGAAQLTRLVSGVDDNGAGMTGFVSSMGQLQTRLADFNKAVEGALQSKVYELEAQIDALEPAGELEDSGVMSAATDDELTDRIKRINSAKQSH